MIYRSVTINDSKLTDIIDFIRQLADTENSICSYWCNVC